MSCRRRPRPPPPSLPVWSGLGPASARCGRALAAAKGPVRRGTDRKEARKEGELPLRVCTRVCVPQVCVRVCARVRVCALPPPTLPPLAPLSLSLSSLPLQRRPLSSAPRAGPSFINMLIAC